MLGVEDLSTSLDDQVWHIMPVEPPKKTKSTNYEFCYMEITPPSAADCFGSQIEVAHGCFINSARITTFCKSIIKNQPSDQPGEPGEPGGG